MLCLSGGGGAAFEFIPFHPQQNPVWQVPLLPTGLQMRGLLLGEVKSFAQVHSLKTTESDPWAPNAAAVNHCRTLPLAVWGHYYRRSCLLGKALAFPASVLLVPYESTAFICRALKALSAINQFLQTCWSRILSISLWKPFRGVCQGREAVGILKTGQGRKIS